MSAVGNMGPSPRHPGAPGRTPKGVRLAMGIQGPWNFPNNFALTQRYSNLEYWNFLQLLRKQLLRRYHVKDIPKFQ